MSLPMDAVSTGVIVTPLTPAEREPAPPLPQGTLSVE